MLTPSYSFLSFLPRRFFSGFNEAMRDGVIVVVVFAVRCVVRASLVMARSAYRNAYCILHMTSRAVDITRYHKAETYDSLAILVYKYI